MILAGIDEAGLGPALGPLCVAAVALRAPDDWSAADPWPRLAAAVVAAPHRAEKRLVVADSKKVFAARSLAALERPAMVFFCASPLAAPLPLRRADLLSRLGAFEALENLGLCPWYEAVWLAPAYCPSDAIGAEAQNLAKVLAAAGAALAGIEARVTLEPVFNRRIARGLNKAQALWEDTASHLRWLASAFPDEPVAVCVDKQGGRHAYLALLRQTFPGAAWQVMVEGAMRSEYALRRSGPPLRVVFLPRAEQASFAVALASIIAKYLRERFMS
ncbi:MAG: hypothetical protein N3A66_09380, partial [Planctomycetota bacterium]|nr:hypothetical protein [Planctomycetota bacterium]